MKKKIEEQTAGTGKKQPFWKKVVGGLFLLLSLMLMGYPFLSEWVFEHRQDSIVETYKSDVESMSEKQMKEAWSKARAYNKKLYNSHVTIADPFGSEDKGENDNYMSLLNVGGNGCMGYIEIPGISVNLPVYHGTSERVLQNGIGHLKESSLPVGGKNSHTILTGHTGLNRAKLFTDLTQMEKGDHFFLYVLDKNLAYEVDQIKVVKPEDTKDLEIETGKDYCTLITCTPYGINSHRLLVRGHRVPYTEDLKNADEKKTGDSQWMSQYRKAMKYAVITIVVLVGISEIIRRKKKNRKINHEEG